MSVIGVIGGSGFYEFPELSQQKKISIETPYGNVDSITQGRLNNVDVFFVPRHGSAHNIPPHKVNYRANIDAFSRLGVESIIAFNATGGIGEKFGPGRFVIPDQVIDYTYGREHTFYDGENESLAHIEFATPFNEKLRAALKQGATESDIDFQFGGTYGCTQGPRLETSAEIKKLQKDGCDLVGMTLMPEAALAREHDLAYASLSLIVNWCSGLSDEVISLDKIMAQLESSIPKIREVILKTISPR